jgi:uncharacterized delta-60 repeat protein
VLVRVTPPFALDAGFGTGGVVTLPGLTGGVGVPRSQLALTDEGIVAAGNTLVNGVRRIWSARLTGGGALDPTYGDGGTQLYADGDDAVAVNVLPDPSGSGAVIVGSTEFNTLDPGDVLLLGITDTGAVDAGYGDGGRVLTDLGQAGIDQFSVVEGLPGGDLLVAGDTGDGGVAARDGSDFPDAVAVRPDGTVLVAHTVVHPAVPIPPHGVQPATFDLRIDALTPAGTTDTSFGVNGSAAVPSAQGTDSPFGPPFTGWMDVDADGNAYIAPGQLLRLDPGGITFTPMTLPAGAQLSAADVVVDADGAIAVTGRGTPDGATPAVDVVARFGPDLQLDASFGTGGMATLPTIADRNTHAGPFLLVGDTGAITVVEHSRASGLTYDDLVVRRLQPDGTADTSFSQDGVAIVAFRPVGVEANLVETTLQGDDVVVAGARGQDPYVARING